MQSLICYFFVPIKLFHNNLFSIYLPFINYFFVLLLTNKPEESVKVY